MKSLGLIFLLSFLVLVLSATVEQVCRKQEGASEEDVLVMKEHRAPETRTQKCFFDCVFQHAGYSNGKRFLKEGFLEKTQPDVDKDPSLQKAIHDLADRCDGLENEDRCELAAEIDACLFKRN